METAIVVMLGLCAVALGVNLFFTSRLMAAVATTLAAKGLLVEPPKPPDTSAEDAAAARIERRLKLRAEYAARSIDYAEKVMANVAKAPPQDPKRPQGVPRALKKLEHAAEAFRQLDLADNGGSGHYNDREIRIAIESELGRRDAEKMKPA